MISRSLTLMVLLLFSGLLVAGGMQLFLAEDIGSDYSFFLPRLLYGYYWQIENGWLSVPWFTPAFCGGLPYFADPQVMFFSVPQWLTALTAPANAVFLTYLVFAGIGGLGMYLLLRQVFELHHWLCMTGAILFTFNEFYLFRMMMGHLTNHAYMLIPLIAWVLARGAATSRHLASMLAAGLLMSYFIHAGGANLLVPSILAVGLLLLLRCLMEPADFGRHLQIGAAAVVIALALSAAKLVPGYAFVSHFPRDGLSLGVFPGLLESLFSTFTMLFASPFITLDDIAADYVIQQAELRYGVTLAPLLILLAGLVAVPSLLKHLTVSRGMILLLILVVVSLPIVLSVRSDEINQVLKLLPYFREMSLAVRWVALLIPLFIVLPLVLVQQLLNDLTESRQGGFVAVLVTLALGLQVLSVILTSRPPDVPYSTTAVHRSYDEVKQGGAVPTVTSITSDPSNRTFSGVDDDFIRGGSSQICYQPLFGYRLEKYPIKDLVPGSIFAQRGEHLNLKQPACYLYPEQNSCSPGDHFKANDRDRASLFATNQVFDWGKPAWHTAAVWLSLVSLCLVVLGLPLSLLPRRQ